MRAVSLGALDVTKIIELIQNEASRIGRQTAGRAAWEKHNTIVVPPALFAARHNKFRKVK